MDVIKIAPSACVDDELPGKDLLGAVIFEDSIPGRPRSKQVLDVVTDDGSTYTWSRFSDAEPFTFENRTDDDGRNDSAHRQLPAVVDAVRDTLDASVLY